VLIVWKLDRLLRSLRDVPTIMERLGEASAGFRRLTEASDTTTPVGRMMNQMVGAFVELERQCSGSEARPSWMPSARKAESADYLEALARLLKSRARAIQ
jgi:DNA invertase Pin-like site-specific DNA recombinase